MKVKFFYLYKGFKRVDDTACSYTKGHILDNLSTAALYCADDENCGGFVDNQGMGKAFVLCFQPVEKLKDSTTKGTILYIKYGESNENYSLSNINFGVLEFSIIQIHIMQTNAWTRTMFVLIGLMVQMDVRLVLLNEHVENHVTCVRLVSTMIRKIKRD